MRTYTVSLSCGFEKRPSRDERAFLRDMSAWVVPWGRRDLRVAVKIDAPDVVAALVQATELVTSKLGGEVLSAEVHPGWGYRAWLRRR